MLEFPSLPDFFYTHQDDIFVFWVYRKVYTPYEQQKAFTDESIFESTYANYGHVVECVSLGGDNYLLGFRVVVDPEESMTQFFDGITYYKLGDIRLELYQPTQKEK